MAFKSGLTQEQRDLVEESISDVLGLFGFSSAEDDVASDEVVDTSDRSYGLTRSGKLAYLVDERLSVLVNAENTTDSKELADLAVCVAMLENIRD
jgi:hypothetical protein